MTESHEPLSPAGRDRRDAILALARSTARRRRRRRRAARAAAGSAIALLVVIAVYTLRPGPGDRPQPVVAERIPSASQNTSPSFASLAVIKTDHTIARRLALAPGPPRWDTISDDELLSSLAQAGEPAGLIEVQGATILVSNSTPVE